MRIDGGTIAVFLSQTDGLTVDALTKAPWYVIAFLAVGGSVGLAAGLREVWKYATTYLDARRQRLAQREEDDRRQREERHKAELAQHEALTTMARSVPGQFESMTREIRESNALTRKELADNTRAVNELIGAWKDESRMLVAAIAQKVGVQNDSPVSRQSNAGL